VSLERTGTYQTKKYMIVGFIIDGVFSFPEQVFTRASSIAFRKSCQYCLFKLSKIPSYLWTSARNFAFEIFVRSLIEARVCLHNS
jgi:hypothetical protein